MGAARGSNRALRGAAFAAAIAAAGVLAAAAAAGDGKHGGHGQIFPVRGPHTDRGPVGEFGALRTGGRTHEGFDVVAACGTPLVAARGGMVLQNRYQPDLGGWEVLIHARGTNRNHRYSHLRKRAIPKKGEIVDTGQRIGSVGKSGNAIYVGCHLHFEMRVHGEAIDPEPALKRWDSWS
jgi:murein DD-endopeptidase MepM/ murein hydrolase activator NlpD